LRNRQKDGSNDIFDRTFIGRPGCMLVLIVLVIVYIFYNILTN